MSIQLNQNEEALRAQIAERMEKARKAFAESSPENDVDEWIMEAGERAHQLHMLLKERGIEPKHHAYMIKNREMQPDATEFYMHYHPIEDLLKFLENEHANDDSVDKTIGADFTFRVFSNRWGHDDTYSVKRTGDGWIIRHMAIGGPCDKGGNTPHTARMAHDQLQSNENFPARYKLNNHTADIGELTQPTHDRLTTLYICNLKAAPSYRTARVSQK